MESEFKKCATENCQKTTKQKYCYHCHQKARYDMKKSGYLPAIVPPAIGKAIKRHGWNGLDG